MREMLIKRKEVPSNFCSGRILNYRVKSSCLSEEKLSDFQLKFDSKVFNILPLFDGNILYCPKYS